MWPISVDARAALRGDHSITARVTAYTAAQGIQPNLPFVDGSVSYDAGSEVQAKAQLTFADPRLWSANPLDVLSPWGSRLFIESGIVLVRDDGARDVEWIPMGMFRIVENADDVPVPIDGITVTLEDDSRSLADAKFDVATQTNTGATIVSEIDRMTFEVLGVHVVDETGSTAMCPKIDLQRDRRGAITKLAAAIGAEYRFDRAGTPRLRPIPTLDSPPVWHITGGEGGTFLTGRRKATRAGAYSRVFASQVLQNTTGSTATPAPTPLTAEAIDGDPTSPTYFYGPFGNVTRKYASPLFTTQAQVQAAADGLLARVRGASYTTEVSHLPNPALELGDVVSIAPRRSGPSALQLVEGFTVQLRAKGGAQDLDSRGIELPPEEAQAETDTDPAASATTAPAAPAEVEVRWVDSTDSGYVVGTGQTVSGAAWDRLLSMGYRGRPDDGREGLYIRQDVIDSVIAEVG